MLSILLTVAVLLGRQDATPWVIHLQDGSRIVAYCDESDFEKDIFTVIEDKPWAEPVAPRTLFKKDVKGHYPAGSAELAAYYAEGWTANGGIQIDTSEGTMWVFEDEYELAQRAAEMARTETPEAADPVNAAAPSASTATPEVALSFGQLWGAHIAVLTVGLGLCALVVWFLILE